mmetsp:Transcript_20463/g.28426  ORF Transcript_20463/g.28426 Transcript_20463/m.28426 type:complete len:143 (+) Transcript_20463:46-474(+)
MEVLPLLLIPVVRSFKMRPRFHAISNSRHAIPLWSGRGTGSLVNFRPGRRRQAIHTHALSRKRVLVWMVDGRRSIMGAHGGGASSKMRKSVAAAAVAAAAATVRESSWRSNEDITRVLKFWFGPEYLERDQALQTKSYMEVH